MSKGGALVRFHDWRAARDHKAVTRHFWRCRCIGLVAVPVSIGLATLVLPVGTSPFCTRRPGGSPWRRSSAPVVDLPDHQGDLQCRARAGEVFCGFL
jgi:hypothetical protein